MQEQNIAGSAMVSILVICMLEYLSVKVPCQNIRLYTFISLRYHAHYKYGNNCEKIKTTEKAHAMSHRWQDGDAKTWLH